jgi:hypothetical protein
LALGRKIAAIRTTLRVLRASLSSSLSNPK